MLPLNNGAVLGFFAAALFFSCLILICQNPIYSLLSLIVSIICILVVFLIIKVEFLALTFLIIYVGAIAILFLFVIMMFNIKRMRKAQMSISFLRMVILTYFALPKLYLVLVENLQVYLSGCNYNLIYTSFLTNDFIFGYDNILYFLKYKTNDAYIFSDFLYTTYCYYVVLVGLLLLSAMIGSIVLALTSAEKKINTKMHIL